MSWDWSQRLPDGRLWLALDGHLWLALGGRMWLALGGHLWLASEHEWAPPSYIAPLLGQRCAFPKQWHAN